MTSAFMPRLNLAGTAWVPQPWDTDGQASQSVDPASGSTVEMTATPQPGTLTIAPGATLAALTVNLPADEVSQVGQVRRILSRRAITALTMGQTGGGATIINAPTSMASGACISFEKVAADTWAYLV